MRDPRPLPVTRHDGGGVNGRHPPRRPRVRVFGAVDQDQVPLHVVNLVGKHVQRQPAPAVSAQERPRGGAFRLVPKMLDQLPRLRHLCGVLYQVGGYVRVRARNRVVEFRVVFQEQGGAAQVCSPARSMLTGKKQFRLESGREELTWGLGAYSVNTHGT
nr:hypothetical protein Ahy_A03g010155 isoform F [Ipomoea batatas]